MNPLATLTVENGKTMISKDKQFVLLTASNGEPLMNGELLIRGDRGREAIIDAMIEVLQSEGYEVRFS